MNGGLLVKSALSLVVIFPLLFVISACSDVHIGVDHPDASHGVGDAQGSGGNNGTGGADGDGTQADALDISQDSNNVQGCDLVAAAQAMANLGLIGTGAAQASDVTLPATLATDATWRVRADACQQGGYDISALAGQTVCLVGQSIPQACAVSPDTVWVVMSGGAVKCIYESSNTPAGIYVVGGSYCSDGQSAADAGQDAAIAPGCDLQAAAYTIGALGLSTVGGVQTMDVQLPTALMSDENWGLKADACQQGGYDISALAGQTVCLVGQGIPQACAASPDTVWVVMSSGAVKCVYESSNTAGPPGIYAVGGSYCCIDGCQSSD